MTRTSLFPFVCMAIVTACHDDLHAPARSPADIQIVTDLPATGVAGEVAASFVVRVTDGAGRPVQGVLVHFAPVMGAARVEPAQDTTGDDGMGMTLVRLSTTPGPNQIEARVLGVRRVRSANTVGAAIEARRFTFSPRLLWFQPSTDRGLVTAVPRDSYGNVVGGAVSWTSRNLALVAPGASSTNSTEVLVVGRPGQTYLVATHGAAIDSILVAVHDASSSRCDFLAPPVELPVGGSLSFESAGATCVRSGTNAAAEYVVVGHYNSPLASATSAVGVVAHGVSSATSLRAAATRAALSASGSAAEFESALRDRERANIPKYVASARDWYDARSRTRSLSAVSRVGDHVSVNVNAFEFCLEPTQRTARVAALTPGTMILEDTSNPPGGFSDEEYASIAATVDTLLMPVSAAAFGEATDIDDNGRVAILFTRAVNELTPRGAGGVIVGFHYSRDLLPRSGASGECPGSNAGEIVYVLVPDPEAVLSDARSKAFVSGVALSTIVHELQHLVNASRRMYVTRTQEVSEETWLNEGLSHIAEELVFYRASGLAPRQNIGGPSLELGTPVREMHELFMRGNFGRYAQFLGSTESTSPMAANDQLATRGASWAFLRYVADRVGAIDGDLWRRLVDGKRTGADNLDQALAATGGGMTSTSALKDWSVAVAVDDVVAQLAPALTQPSWHFSTAMPALGYRSGPASTGLVDGQPSSFSVRAGGSGYFSFGLDAGREALVQISSGGGVAQPGMRLTLVRIK